MRGVSALFSAYALNPASCCFTGLTSAATLAGFLLAREV